MHMVHHVSRNMYQISSTTVKVAHFKPYLGKSK